ncbi:MAG: hypothetical protein GX589_09340 [Deltaproteobacteria bacterium]|nr:hypothetical protein [Deltaproteobacteria bacterium]
MKEITTRKSRVLFKWVWLLSATLVFALVPCGRVLAQCKDGICPSTPPTGYGWDNPHEEFPWNGYGNGAIEPGPPSDDEGAEGERDWKSWPLKALLLMQLIKGLEPSTGGGGDNDDKSKDPEDNSSAPTPTPTPEVTTTPPPSESPTPTPTPVLKVMDLF